SERAGRAGREGRRGAAGRAADGAPGVEIQSRMWRAPAASLARMTCSEAMAQQRSGAYASSVATVRPVARFHTLSVLSEDVETAQRPSAVTATPATSSV